MLDQVGGDLLHARPLLRQYGKGGALREAVSGQAGAEVGREDRPGHLPVLRGHADRHALPAVPGVDQLSQDAGVVDRGDLCGGSSAASDVYKRQV